MLTRTSTIRSKLAVCAVAVALVAGVLAAPAAAETERKRWLPNQDPAARSGNVEQGGRQVNHRNDGYDRGKPPVWSTQPGERGRIGSLTDHRIHCRPPQLIQGFVDACFGAVVLLALYISHNLRVMRENPPIFNTFWGMQTSIRWDYDGAKCLNNIERRRCYSPDYNKKRSWMVCWQSWGRTIMETQPSR